MLRLSFENSSEFLEQSQLSASFIVFITTEKTFFSSVFFPADCDFELNTCKWKSIVLPSTSTISMLQWIRTETAVIRASNKSGYAMFVPVTQATTAATSTAMMKSRGPISLAKGQLFCLRFDYVVTQRGLAWLVILASHYGKVTFNDDDAPLWSSDQQYSAPGEWRLGQVLVEGDGGFWTVSLAVFYRLIREKTCHNFEL